MDDELDAADETVESVPEKLADAASPCSQCSCPQYVSGNNPDTVCGRPSCGHGYKSHIK